MGNDLTRGYTYADGAALNAVNLNAHVDDATLKATSISARTAKTTLTATDEFLINDAGTLKKMTGGVLLTGHVIQTLQVFYAANTALTNVVPLDDTIPTISEGTQIISQAITLNFSTSKVIVKLSGMAAMSLAGSIIAFIYRDSTALLATAATCTAANQMLPITMITWDTPGTVGPFTYTVRAGPSTAGTVRFNGTSAARLFGGAAGTILELQEVKV